MPLTKSSRKSYGGRDNSPEPGPSKGDKCSSDEDDEPIPRKGKGYQNSKNKQGKLSKKSPNVASKQSGLHSGHNKTAELFRKDLISAMKMADTEILYDSDYFVISDPWRQEWEKSVQVPVNEGEILPTEIRELRPKSKQGDFKFPQRKYLHEKIDETYQASLHELTNMQEVADAIVRYDLDDQDVAWLELVNEDREEMGLQLINEWNLERMIEELENQCYVKTNALKKTEEGLGIEYDEDVACDVCRMLESEDTNEMVFCDGCDICVHQACYGIQTIPEGSWLCRICALGIKPMCLLCPKRGGAMKSTKSGTKWTHVSCALWIPEVSIGCPEKMEPITKISNIPPSRWALVCCLCKERVGACIQCSVKQCKTAFHVTCGFAHNLDMQTIVDDSDEADGIHLRAYCPKHTKNRNASDSESPKKEDFVDNENDISEAEMAKKRSEKLKQLEEEFHTLVDIHEISSKFFIPEEAIDVVAEYWKLKRKVNKNKPLITPKMEEEDQMQKQQQDSLSARMKMFVHLRQDLERARNLCYMISKREKNKRQLFKMKESVFHAQINVLTDPDLNLSARDAEKVRQEYYFDSIYSDYGVMSARSSKQPRENLFTLENLKTPKDFDESDFESNKKREKVSNKSLKLNKSVIKKDNDKINLGDSPTPTTSVSDKSDGHQRDSFFLADGFKMLNDSTAESSEDESLATLVKSTQSSQMSRLGKVKLEEIEEKGSDGETGIIKTIPESPTKKFVPSSDLRKKLTSILQSKNMMHQRNEKVHSVIPESVKEALHVDVNSDIDIFTSDTNTDLMSPVDQPRNLFDQFSMQGRSILSSPDTPNGTSERSDSLLQLRKYKTKRHGRCKRKRSRHIISPSDRSSTSSTTVKPESAVSGDADSMSTGYTCHLPSDDTDHDMSSLSPACAANTSDLDCHNSSLSFNSSPQSGKGKKRKLPLDINTSEFSGKSLRSLTKPLPQISPSPRVNPNDIYATIDGDIYVPSGKIQVTERTIILNDLVEEDQTRPRSKLRLKKQTNSPVKGIISYEVVKDEDDRHDIFEDKKSKNNISEDKKPKNEVYEDKKLKNDISEDKKSRNGVYEDKKLKNEVSEDKKSRNGVSEDKKLRNEVSEDKKSRNGVSEDKKSKNEGSEDKKLRNEAFEDKKSRNEDSVDKKSRNEVAEVKKLKNEVSEDKKLRNEVFEDKKSRNEDSVDKKSRNEVAEVKKLKNEVSEDKKSRNEVSEDKRLRTDVSEDKKLRTEDKKLRNGVSEDKKLRNEVSEDKKSKNDEEKRNIFDNVIDRASSQIEDADKKVESEVPSISPRSLRKHKKLEDTGSHIQDRKISETNNVNKKEEVVERDKSSRKDLFNVGVRRKRSRGKSPLSTVSISENNSKKGDSTDENFKPKVESSKSAPPLTRRSQAARQEDADGDDESEELKECSSSRKKCTYNRAATNSDVGYGVVLKPLPNKPALTALYDSRQLIVKDDLKKRVVANLDKIVKGRSRWRGTNGIRNSTQTTIERFVKRTSSSENVFSKPDVIKDPNAKRWSLPIGRNDLTPLRVNKSSSMNSQNDGGKTSSITMSHVKAASIDNIFGAHSSSKSILSNYRIPKKCDNASGDQNRTPKKSNEFHDKQSDQDVLFGDVDKLQNRGLKERLSFEDVSRSADLVEVVKTPPKCDPCGMNEDKLEGHRSYRSQSPPSSEGSGASSRILQLDSRESTPSRRITRSHVTDDSQNLSTRSRTKDGLLKAPQLKFS